MKRSQMYGTKTRRGKKVLESRDPKVVENDKTALIVKGGKTSEDVSQALAALYALKKPLALQLKRYNPFHLFEDDTGIVKFAQKFDSSLFLFGSHSKKHPNSLIFGRMHDYQVLDMVDLSIKKFISSDKFNTGGVTFGCKPCILLQGTAFESDEAMKRVGNLMIDWFRGPTVSSIRLQGLELIISLTAVSTEEILFRVYRTQLKKSGGQTPRVELVEIGPSIDFAIVRKKLASDDFFKSALKKPKELHVKPRKNISRDVFGTQLARIHVGRQQPETIKTRKMKVFKKPRLS
ncbi:brix domain-containing protein [Ditylenchus destructor]|uniref:Ribosome production factor 2 homolog n=1 Tax=Ditylenchus destructor TaxID=166010 RepID=A0AAD4RCM0_9BILA|nr:brix domain-containing protein [Ditylenchus destructor]